MPSIKYFDDHDVRLPVMASMTIFQGGRTLSAQTIEAAWNSIAHADLLSVGINCALGPEHMRPYLEELSQISPVLVSCYPNAGLPNAFGGFDESPEMMAQTLAEFAVERLAEPGRRLLRLHAGTYPRHCRTPWPTRRRASDLALRR